MYLIHIYIVIIDKEKRQEGDRCYQVPSQNRKMWSLAQSEVGGSGDEISISPPTDRDEDDGVKRGGVNEQ